MSSINALPEEVLCKVISFIQHDHAALRALTHVSHDFNCSTLPYLVRHISFIIRKPDHSFSTSFELFMRSLRENNKIALYVQTVKLQWSTGTSITKDNRRAYSHANDLLRKLPNIRILSLSIIGPLPVPFDHGFLDANPLPLLREFKLFDFNATAAHISKYMISTPVQTMKIERLNVHAPLSRSIRETSPSRTSKLSSLRLPYFHLPTSILSDILCLPKSLEILHCTLPGDQELRFGALQASMRSALSPIVMTRVLEPVKNTLVELRLDDGILTRWPRHDESRIDFSQLNALRRLGISSSCLFPFPTVKEKEREGLWRLLPSQIEELDISFNFNWHFLRNHPYTPKNDNDDNNNNDTTTNILPQISWLTELVSVLPHLQRIGIEEHAKHPRGYVFSKIEWPPPDPLKDLLDMNGVRLVVFLRSPVITR